MRRILSAILVMLLSLLWISSSFALFEPDELLQWDKDKKFTGSISFRYYLLNNQPVQLGKSVADDVVTLTEGDLHVQYRFYEGQSNRGECYLGGSTFTHWDVFDRLRFAAECGYTFKLLPTLTRLSIGKMNELNIGASQPRRGVSAYWFGVANKLYQDQTFFLAGYGRYYVKSNMPSNITQHFGVLDDHGTLRGELGLQATAKLGKVEFFLSPYTFLNDSVGISRVGSYGGIRYNLLRNLKAEIGGNYDANADFKRNEKQFWFKLIFEFK